MTSPSLRAALALFLAACGQPDLSRDAGRDGSPGSIDAGADGAADGGAEAGSERVPLRLADFTPLGGFLVPDDASDDLQFGTGLTHRYVDGELRLYTLGYQRSSVVEFAPVADDALRLAPPFDVAVTSREYGDIFQDHLRRMVGDGRGGDEPPPYIGVRQFDGQPGRAGANGLFWDPIDERMYWTQLAGYDTGPAPGWSDSDLCFGYSTLDDASATGTGVGSWRISRLGDATTPDRIGNRWTYGMCAIPSAFADRYLGGRRLGIGFGGPPSIASNGPVAIGPTLIAIGAPEPGIDPEHDWIAGGYTKLVHHPFGAADRERRPVGMVINNGEDGTLFDWSDSTLAGVWIDGARRHGFVAFSRLVGGNVQTVVAAEPAPTPSSFAVPTIEDLGDLVVGDVILVTTDTTQVDTHYPWASATVTAIDGRVVSIGPTRPAGVDVAEGGAPIVGGEVFAGQRYIGGGQFVTRMSHALFVYDPADLARVATGELSTTELTWAVGGELRLPGIQYPLGGGGAGNNPASITAATFDATTGRLYLHVRIAPDIGTAVYVYAVDA